MKPEDFAYFCKLILDRTGLVLGADKTYLIESRLTPVARRHWRACRLLREGATQPRLAAERSRRSLTHQH